MLDSTKARATLSLSSTIAAFMYKCICIYVCMYLQDVFTVSVGNLPPGASVLIKITYVAELLVEGENIVFSLPGSVAPWKKDAALDTTTQVSVCMCVLQNLCVE